MSLLVFFFCLYVFRSHREVGLVFFSLFLICGEALTWAAFLYYLTTL